jgi:hypothetical protein
MKMNLKVFLFCLIFFSQETFSQTDKKDTTIFYSIIIIEKENCSKNIRNLVISGAALDSFYIISKHDTIRIGYKFPFLIIDKKAYLNIKNSSIGENSIKNYLCFYYKNLAKEFWLKLSLNFLFDEYWLEMIHKRKQSDYFDCSINTYWKAVNTNNIEFFSPLIRSSPLKKSKR